MTLRLMERVLFLKKVNFCKEGEVVLEWSCERRYRLSKELWWIGEEEMHNGERKKYFHIGKDFLGFFTKHDLVKGMEDGH